jgi:hypothetical protein
MKSAVAHTDAFSTAVKQILALRILDSRDTEQNMTSPEIRTCWNKRLRPSPFGHSKTTRSLPVEAGTQTSDLPFVSLATRSERRNRISGA